MRIVSGIIVFLCLANVLTGQTILFEENFDSCTLSDKWHYTLEGNQNVAWGVGIPTNPKAEGLSMNGTCFLFIDDDLTGDKTPPFKLRVYSDYFNGNGYSDINFQADVHFRRDKTEVLKIFIDNGKEEYLIRTFKNTNFSGSKFNEFIRMNSDISFYASDSMRIIIEYDDDNQWGWWAGIDNIMVTANQQGNIVLGQTFNGCAKPDDWQTEIVNGIDDWQFGIFHDGKTMDGTCFTFFNDDILGKDRPLSKIRLYSPFFKGDEYGNYILVYDLIFRTYEPSEYLQIYIDNGREWIPVKSYNGDIGGPNVNQYEKETIDLSPYRSENIRLIWEYNDGGWAWWLGLDNIKVVGQGELNDRCEKAISLTKDGDCLPFDNTNALTKDEWLQEDPKSTGKVYFTWTADADGPFQVETRSSFNDVLQVFSGGCDSPNLVSTKNKDEFGFKGEDMFLQAAAGTTYIFRVTGYESEFGLDRGQGCIRIRSKSDTSAPPVNDLCHEAIVLTTDADCAGTRNIIAALDGPLPSKNLRSRADVWYIFTPQTSGDYVFTSSADFADVITLYSGNCQQVIEMYSDYSGQKAELKELAADSVYFIQVTGYFALLEGNLCGKITKKQTITPDNPVCQQAIPLTVNAQCISYSNQNAGFSGIRPKCDVTVYDDIWFSFVAPANGTVYWRVKSDFPNLTSVYSGNCQKLTSLHCIKNKHHCSGYTKLEALEAGKTYYIQIGSAIYHEKHKSGTVCIEMLDTDPAFHPVQLTAEQECISRGAVKFIPSASGGHEPYVYYGLGLDNPVGGNDVYVIEVTDAEGCVAFVNINAQTCLDFGCQMVASEETFHIPCHGATSGQIILNTSGGLEPYQYQWSNGLVAATAENLSAGNYSVTITDASGCQITKDITLYQPAKMATNASFTTPTCNGEANGAIEILPTGGNGNYQFAWSNGSTEQDLHNIPGGRYSLTITDGAGCSFTEEIHLEQPAAIQADSMIQHNVCFGEASGSIRLNGKGGTGNLNILWANGQTTAEIQNLSAGLYSATITDENLCSLTRSWTIRQPDSFFIMTTYEDLVITDTKNARIAFVFSGGTSPYQITWFRNNTVVAGDSLELTMTETGEYRAEITDALGCNWQSPIWMVTKTSSADDEGKSINIALRPNPVMKELWISTSNSAPLEDLSIKNSEGKVVWTYAGNYFFGYTPIDVSRLSSGTYFIAGRQGKDMFVLPFVKVE